MLTLRVVASSGSGTGRVDRTTCPLNGTVRICTRIVNDFGVIPATRFRIVTGCRIGRSHGDPPGREPRSDSGF